MARQQIDPKKAPILWDTVNEAFEKINSNFVELYLSLGAGGVVDLSNLSSSVSPNASEIYSLGTPTKRWKDLYLGGSSLYLGDALITASGSSVNLPPGSTIGGSILDQEYFREIAVAGQSNIVADSGGTDILTIAAGNSGITLTTNATTDTLTITNSGVVNVLSGNAGISVSGTTTKTISNTGVLDITTTPGSGISINQPNGNVVITNSGVTRLEAGGGITLDANTGVITITNNSPNIVQNLWRFIAVSGYTNLDPSNASSTLTFEAGDGMNVQSSLALNKLTFINTGVTGASAGAGISVSSATGSITITNTGVTSLTAGSGIGISASTGGITVTNTRPGFTNIAVQGQGPIQADNETDTLVLIAGTGIELVADPVTDSIVISAEANIQSSIYSEGSTLLVDAVQGKIVGPIDSFDGGNSITMDPLNGVILGGTGGVTLIGAATAPIYIGYGPSGTTTGNIYIGNPIGSRTIVFENPTSGISYNDLNDLPDLGSLGGGGGGGGENFELNVASDDSTIRRIHSGETLKFVGTGGITTSSDAEGQITISGAALTSLAGRGDVFATSVSLTNGATGNLTITGFKGYMMYKIATSAAAWVRVYTSVSARTADSGRVEGTDPTPGAGVIAEVVTTGAETVLMSPGVIGFNNESIPNNNIEVAVTNKSGGTTTITVTLTIVKLES